MTGVDLSLLIGLIFACVASLRSPRAWAWLAATAVSYVVSTIAWRIQLPGAVVITALGDAAVCLAIYFFGRFRWEMWIWRLLQISVAISIFYLAGSVGVFSDIPHYVYAILLEAINWLVLLSIGGSAAFQWFGNTDDGILARRSWSRVRAARVFVWAQRAEPQFFDKAAR